MGTRGCVALGTPEKWTGVYNHFDSYPEGLGKDVWEEIQERPEALDHLLEFSDWREYLSGGICHYCGKKAGQPHSILVNEFTNKFGGDPESNYHSHNEGPASDHYITNEDSDPLYIEYVYIIDKGSQTLHILGGKSKHEVLTSVKFTEREPDWSSICKYEDED